MQIGLEFEIDSSNYQEDMTLEMEPLKLAAHLSLGKAKDVARRHKDAIIISADTMCVLNGKVFGKAKSDEEAKEMLRQFSGKVQQVITGFTIIDTTTGKEVSKSVTTNVYFRDIFEEEIDAYIASGEPKGFAGAYAIQHKGGLFIEKIEGDYFNIVGLPILPLHEELKNFGINVFEKNK
jgi:septum formation protein